MHFKHLILYVLLALGPVCMFGQDAATTVLSGHSAPVNCIDLSPDGTYLISGSKDETIRVWNLKSGQCEKTIKTQGSSVKKVRFNSEGTKFLAALYGRFAEVDFKSFKFKYSKKGIHSAFLETCLYSEDGKHILTSSWRDKTLVVFKGSNLKKEIETEETTWVDNAIFNKSASLIYSGGHDNLVKSWDISTGGLVKSYAGHDDWVYDICLSADEKILYSGSFDKTIKVWDLNTGKNIGTLKGHKEGIVCLEISKNGKYLASGGMDKEIIIWDLNTRLEIKRIQAHEACIMDLKFSADNKTLYSCSVDKSIKVWNTSFLD